MNVPWRLVVIRFRISWWKCPSPLSAKNVSCPHNVEASQVCLHRAKFFRTDDIDRLTVTLSSSLSSFLLANTRVSRHLNTDVFSTLKCRMLFLLVMHSRTPLEKNYFFLSAIAVISIVNHICVLHHLNEPSSIFTHASCCILDTLAEPCFLHVPSLTAVTIFVDFLQSVWTLSYLSLK